MLGKQPGEFSVVASGEQDWEGPVRNEAEDAGFIISLLLSMLFKLHICVTLMKIKVIFLKSNKHAPF